MAIGRSGRKILFFTAFGLSVLFFGSKVNGAGIFPKNQYTVAQGQDILLAQSSKASYKREWRSYNTKVATVDSRGIVHSVSKGKTTIEAINKKTHHKSVCTLEVVEPELLKNCYSSRGSVGCNESFKICAITQTNVHKVKFKVRGNDYYKEYEMASGKNEGQSKIWKMSISIPNSGQFSVHIDCHAVGGWESCNNRSINNIIVSKSSGSTSVNDKEKRVSAACARFIASCEGTRSKVYVDCAGHMTIGCGKKLNPYEPFYNNLSNDEIMAYFMDSLNQGSYARTVNNFLRSNKIKYSQSQFDSLVSFSFNLGVGWLTQGSRLKTLLLNCGNGNGGQLCATVNVEDTLRVREEPNTSSRKLKVLVGGERVILLSDKKFNDHWYKIKTGEGVIGYCYSDYLSVYRESSGVKSLNHVDKNKFIDEFLLYHHAGGKCYSALLSRRAQELDMFFSGKYSRYDWQYYKKMQYKRPKCTVGKF